MSLLIDFVAYHAKSRPNKLACRDLDRGLSLTYAELDQRVNELAGYMSRFVHPGDRVGVLSRNRPDVMAAQWASIRLGALFVPFNWRLSEAEIRAQAKDSTPSLVLYEDEFLPLALACGCPVQLLDDAVDEFCGGPASRFDAEDVATLLYTSGTTGKPKGVIFTELNAFYSTINYSQLAQAGPDSVFLCDAPMFHTIGLYALSRCPMQLGATVLYSSRFEPNRTYQNLIDPALGVSNYMAAPQMLESLRGAEGFDAARLTKLRAILTGGAPFAPERVRAWARSGVRVAHGYGMSENGTIMHMPLDPAAVDRKPDSSGIPGPTVELRLVSPSGEDVAQGEVGEIWTRGPSVSPGYWNNPEATAASRNGDWFKTGDAAWQDEEGYFHICDRLKDMYISGGENIFPAEVEAVLLSHAGVSEAAVIGVADDKWGEVGWAVIIGQASEAELEALCRANLASYKRPKRFIHVQSLPRTLSGKVQKHVLRQTLESLI
ncbi:MAG: feruloyl-CoA synthetase [Caulobacteraceae bacterium]|nr:feruloyl-CoA synthetase [Caulobacteraceae bacterium]